MLLQILVYLFIGLIFAMAVARYVNDNPREERLMFLFNLLLWPLVLLGIFANFCFEVFAKVADKLIKLSRYKKE